MTKPPPKHLLPLYLFITAPLVAQTWSTGAPVAAPWYAHSVAVAEGKPFATAGEGVSRTFPDTAIGAISLTTLNFDSVGTSAAPYFVDATTYLNSHGISVSTITPGTHLNIVNDLGYYNGLAVSAPSPPNTLTQMGSNAPVTFTLSFSTPLDSFSFKRSSLIAATKSGVTHPYWRATAFNAVGMQIGPFVGENNFGSFINVPAATFSLTGPGIASVRFDSENRGSGFNAVVLDDFVLSYAAPIVTSFTATPAAITAGGSSTLRWTTMNATSVTVSGVAGTQTANGSLSVTPASTTTYTLSATGAGGTATATATVTVNPASPTVVSFVATPATVTAGQSSVLKWTTVNATSVTISGVAGPQAANGTLSVTPTSTTTYTLTATGPGGTATAAATVTIVPALIRGRAVRHPGPSAYVGQVNLVLTMPLQPDERQFFELNPGALTADNLTLSPAGIVFPPQPARGYRVTLGDQKAMVMLDGTFRLAAPLSATTGEIVSLDGAFRKSFTPDLLVPEGATPKTIEIPMLLTGQTSGMSVPSPTTAAKDEDVAAIAGDAVGCAPSSPCVKDECQNDRCCLDYNGDCSASKPVRWQGCLLRFQQLINSTCFWWIARGPCANESAVVHVDGPSCYVNHKGRYCQEMDPTTLGLQFTAGTVTKSPLVNPRVVDLQALFPAPIVTEAIDVACGSTATLHLYNNTFDPETWLFLNAGILFGCTAGGSISPSGIVRHYETVADGFNYISEIPISYTAPSDIRAECGHKGTDTVATLAAGLLRVVTIQVNCSHAASITSFVANPSTIAAGQSSTLSWVTMNATSVSISNVTGSQPANCSVAVSLSKTTTFTLTARGPGAAATATVTVTVNPTPPIVASFVANPATIAAGQSSALSWVTANATAVSISGVAATQPVTGSVSVSPVATTTYTLTATGPGGTATAMATVTVNAAASPPTVLSFTASPSTITVGQTAMLSWTTTNTTSVSISGVAGTQAPNGSVSVSPAATSTYTLTARGLGGTATATTTVTLTPSTTTYYWANWSCGSSSQCADVQGRPNGSAGPFCTASDCNAYGIWSHIPLGYSCAVTATYTKYFTVTPSNGVCFKDGVDFNK